MPAPDNYVAYWKQKQAEQQHKNQQLAQAARYDLERIAQALRDNYGVQRIILCQNLSQRPTSLRLKPGQR